MDLYMKEELWTLKKDLRTAKKIGDYEAVLRIQERLEGLM